MLDIRNAQIEDLDEISAVESKCFPPNEAASKESLKERLEVFPNHFWLLERDGKLVSMVNGLVSDSEVLTDEMYEDAHLHQEDGKWQFLFGVETDPDYQGKGYASILMKEVIKDCVNDSRNGIVLTCKEKLIPFYESLGFTNQGISKSQHGGETWYQMIMDLRNAI